MPTKPCSQLPDTLPGQGFKEKSLRAAIAFGGPAIASVGLIIETQAVEESTNVLKAGGFVALIAGIVLTAATMTRRRRDQALREQVALYQETCAPTEAKPIATPEKPVGGPTDTPLK